MKRLNLTIKRTNFLFPERNFISGLASLLCIFGDPKKFNFSETEEDADYKAIMSDWYMVGTDFYTVLKSTISANAQKCKKQNQLN